MFFFLLLIFIGIHNSNSQHHVSISIHQDLKLMAFGDNRGNMAGTLDILGRVKYQAPLNEFGYFIYFAEVERANIAKGYTRFGVGIGYAFNTIFTRMSVEPLNNKHRNFEITPALGLGAIARHGKTSLSFSASLEFAYKISRRFKISVINQFTERSDLRIAYGTKEAKYSFFIGLEYGLFRLYR